MRTCVSRIASVVLLAAFASCATADIVPGADWHLKNAEVVVLARAQTEAEAKAFPPPRGQQRLVLRSVLKGFTTRQHWLVPEGKVTPGQEAVVLQSYEPRTDYEPALTPRKLDQRGNLFVWPVTDGKAMTGVPEKTSGRRGFGEEPIPLAALRDEIARETPEAVDLQEHLLAVLLFPDKAKALAQRDPKRAAHVRFIAAVLDLERDVDALAGLLESPDGGVREEASVRLAALTGEKLAAPREDSPEARESWASRWRQWWERNRDERVWDEAKMRWRARVKADPPARGWPAVPADLQWPADTFPEPLLGAIEKGDAVAFGPAFRGWLDSGVRRDRTIKRALSLSPELRKACHLEGGSGPYLGPAPRLPREVFFNDKVAVADRASVVALLALNAHFDRFVRERRQAVQQTENEPVGSELLRRAAFWEMRDTNLLTAGSAALQKVAVSPDKADQRILAALFKTGIDDALYAAARASIQAGREEFVAVVLDHLRCKNDRVAEWTARILAQEHQPAVLPVLLDKLKEKDPAVRNWAAFALCWYPTKDTVPGMLAAIEAEKDAAVKMQMLVALAQTGDPRGLDPLMTAAKAEKDKWNQIELARGLGRIKDKQALPVLAQMAQATKDDQLRSEVVNAFGYVSGLFRGFEPHKFWSGGGSSAEQIKAGMEAIDRWQREQRQ
jgi:hypothetical protein